MPEVRDNFGDERCATENVLCSKRVTINGLSYGKGTVLLQRIDSDVNFVKVVHVVVHEQAKYLYCKNLTVKYFDAHLNAFMIEDCDTYCVIPAAELYYKWPQLSYDNFVMMQNVDDTWML